MSGGFFSMEDGEQKKEVKSSRHELKNLKSQFMDRAKEFMDDSALGEGRKSLQKFMRKVQGEDEPLEAEAGSANEEEWEDDWEDEGPPAEELDWSRPEYIRAGYAKPGTKYEEARSLEDAQEESFDLKMGGLSGLLSRFGSEDALPEEAPAVSGQSRREMDKPLFRQKMKQIFADLDRQAGQALDSRLWLHPEVLTLLRTGNGNQRVLQFVMATLFAHTEENYLTESDLAWVEELTQRAGFMVASEEIQRQTEQTFLFAERVHRLYQNLLDEPLILDPNAIESYRQNLAKLYIFEVAKRYQAEPGTVIRALAARWQEAGQTLQAALKVVEPQAAQYARFQERKMSSSSLFQKLRQVEDLALQAYQKMQTIADEIEKLKQVTRLIEEEDALDKLNQFQTDWVLGPKQLIGSQMISLYELRQQFVEAQIVGPSPPALSVYTEIELGPVEQKRAISRAKEGELKSLKLIQQYKNHLIHAPIQQVPQPPQQVSQQVSSKSSAYQEAQSKRRPTAKEDLESTETNRPEQA